MPPRLVAFSVYLPPLRVRQEDVAVYTGVPPTKLTEGLGQLEMAITGDAEDAVSLARNALDRLLAYPAVQDLIRRYPLGRLEVGTESSVDGAKSIKSHLVDMLPTKALAGADCINACLGGVVALQNSLCWLASASKESSAIVITTDIATYSEKSSFPTGGAGAIAMLLLNSRDVPGLECDNFQYHWENEYDFYKPHVASREPVVAGAYSLETYLKAGIKVAPPSELFRRYAYICFHTPFCALPRKLHALLYSDCSLIEKSRELSKKEDVTQDFRQRVEPGLKLSRYIGNIYTGSLFLVLVSTLKHLTENSMKEEQEIYCSAYGSGYGACSFTVRVYDLPILLIDDIPQYSLDGQEGCALIKSVLTRRRMMFDALKVGDPLIGSGTFSGYLPQQTTHLPSGTWRLQEIDSQGRRSYTC